MCRPGHGSSRDPSAGGHTGPPLREGVFGNQRKFVRETDLAPTGRDRARPLQGDREWTDGGVRLGSGGVWSPRPTGATQVMPNIRADVGIGPYEKERATSTTRASGAQRSVCAADGRDGWESRQRSPQKGPSTPDNPSVSLRLTAPFTQGSLGDGGCGLPRRFAPRNDSPDPLSFRGGPTGRRGNPSFLRWTMDGGSGRPTKDEGNGTPSRRPLRKAQSTTQASRRAAKRPRQRPRGVGGNRRKDHPKRGQPPRLPGQRLAKRKARG